MRHFMPFLATAALVLSTAAASADLGDQLAKLLPDDGAASDKLGRSVAISGTTAIVGAWWDDDNGTDSGSAYLFDITTGRQIAKLLPGDGEANDNFGRSVAISGVTALVGTPWDDDNGSNSGSAYLFNSFTGHSAKLLPDDGAAHDHFGLSVAISGTTAIVGAMGDDDEGCSSGSAYLFDVSTGQQIARLVPDDGQSGDHFGISVAISGARAIVGAIGDDEHDNNSGSAYVFDTATGQQISKFAPKDGAFFDLLGVSVAISGTTAIVGVYHDDDNGVDSGSAYLFDATTGRQIAKLLPDDGAANDLFGKSVAISGATAIVGAYHDDDNGVDSGSAYLFDANTGRQIAKLLPEDGAALDSFGFSVAISGTTAMVGAKGNDDNGSASGSAYLFDAAVAHAARGISMAPAMSQRLVWQCCWAVGSRAADALPTSSVTATWTQSIWPYCSALGGLAPDRSAERGFRVLVSLAASRTAMKGAEHERLEVGDHIGNLLWHLSDNSCIGVGGLRRCHDGDQG